MLMMTVIVFASFFGAWQCEGMKAAQRGAILASPGTHSAELLDHLPPGWRRRLGPEKDKKYFRDLADFLNSEDLAQQTVYPSSQNVLRALQMLDYDDVRVVVLGQDPYHGSNQAMGLSFAVPNSLRPKPPSLMNIFKEIASDLKVPMDLSKTDLTGWVRQGVLLLNTVLTVRAAQAFSHRGKGWEYFTDRVLEELGAREKPLVFLLWGSAAHKKKALIQHPKHLILEAVHPSPLSAHRGFFGCRHFSQTNTWLQSQGFPPIEWERTVV
jgi:uracil-DNA glycosylase